MKHDDRKNLDVFLLFDVTILHGMLARLHKHAVQKIKNSVYRSYKTNNT